MAAAHNPAVLLEPDVDGIRAFLYPLGNGQTPSSCDIQFDLWKCLIFERRSSVLRLEYSYSGDVIGCCIIGLEKLEINVQRA